MSASQASLDRPADTGGATNDSASRVKAGERRSSPSKHEIRRILGLSVPVSVILAERDMTIGSILGLTAGAIIEFDVRFDADLTLHAADRTIGRGQAVKVGENFGLRVRVIDDVHGRIEAMGGS